MANNNKQFIENLTHKSFYPWVVWGLAASFFFFEYLARVAPGVMVDELMRDLHVTAFALGSLSAFFYYAYIGMQIPVGMLADRFSPRWLLTSMTLLTALSCIIFASAHNMGTAAFGRLVMGFGSAFAFVTALKVAAIWFPSQRLGLLAGLTQALGMFGAGISQVVVAHGVGTIGWRPTMILISCLFILLSFTISLFVREKAAVSKKIEDTVASGKEVWLGLLAVLKNPQTWWNGLFVGLLYAPTEALAELWGVKFLRQTHGLSNEVAAFAIGLIFIGWTVGAPLSGWISDYIRRRKPVIIVSALLSLIFISLVLYLPHLTPLVLFPLLFFYGVSNTGVATSYAIAAEINPRPVSGTSMAFANMASVLVGGAFQPLIGWLLDKHWDGKIVNGIPIYSIADFRVALMALPICLLIAIFVAMRVKETHGELMDAKITI